MRVNWQNRLKWPFYFISYTTGFNLALELQDKPESSQIKRYQYPMNDDSFTRAGTAGGTLTIIFANLFSADILKTIVLAALGAAVSFFVSMFLKKVMKRK